MKNINFKHLPTMYLIAFPVKIHTTTTTIDVAASATAFTTATAI